MDGWYGRIFGGAGSSTWTSRSASSPRRSSHDLLYEEPTKIKVEGINLTYEGVIPKIQKSMLSKDVDAHAAARPRLRGAGGHLPDLPRVRRHPAQPRRRGRRRSRARTSPTSARCRSATWPTGSGTSTSRRWRRCSPALQHLLDSFAEIGLGYLSLDRPAGTLSGGEAQRTKMIRHLGSSLTDVTYVFDEPTIGLHPHDIERMNNLLLQLRDKGNTVLVVEHKPETIAIADHVVDLGPGAGTAGGTVCFEGTVDGLRGSDTITGRHLDDRATLKDRCVRRRARWRSAARSTHNLQDVDVDIPLGVLCVITGVAGSGKSSLIHGSVAGRDGVVVIDQGAIRGSRRSNPATYTGLLEPIRKAFAKANGVKPALFSSNSEGACPTCNGAGVIYTELGDDGHRRVDLRGVRGQAVPGGGARVHAGRPEHRRGARDVGDRGRGVLRRRRGAHAGRPQDPRPARRRRARLPVALGQPLTTLSGGERQRLKLATQMAEKGDVYILDEPTTGLHLADVEQLLGLLDRLVDSGKSVHRHRAPPGGHGARRLDHRPRPRRRARRRPGRLRGHPRRPVAARSDPHRRAPRGVRRRVTAVRTNSRRWKRPSRSCRTRARIVPCAPADW